MNFFVIWFWYICDRQPLIDSCTSIAKCPDAKPSSIVIKHVCAVNTCACILQDRFWFVKFVLHFTKKSLLHFEHCGVDPKHWSYLIPFGDNFYFLWQLRWHSNGADVRSGQWCRCECPWLSETGSTGKRRWQDGQGLHLWRLVESWCQVPCHQNRFCLEICKALPPDSVQGVEVLELECCIKVTLKWENWWNLVLECHILMQIALV